MENRNSEFGILKVQPSPFILLLFLTIFCIGGMLISQFVGYTIGQGFGLDMTQPNSLYTNVDARVPLLLAQFVYSLFLFIIAPYVFLRYFDQDLLKNKIVGIPKFPLLLLPLTVIILFAYFPLSGYLVKLNEAFTFPENMRAFEVGLQELEGRFKELTEFVVAFASFEQFLLGLFVIAVIPAIGEEFLFRGIIQTYFGKIFKNPHVAIWTSALLFSAFHLQFYGLLPRMALGALFGYMFYWSGRLIFSMLAHFINNGFTLLLMYLKQIGVIDINVENGGTFTVVPAIICLVFVMTLMNFFRKKATNQQASLFSRL